MNNQKVASSPTGGAPKKLLKVPTPGVAPPVGAAPKRLRSSGPLTPGPASTRDYGKAPPTPLPGYGDM
jgi:hypothetical protein